MKALLIENSSEIFLNQSSTWMGNYVFHFWRQFDIWLIFGEMSKIFGHGMEYGNKVTHASYRPKIFLAYVKKGLRVSQMSFPQADTLFSIILNQPPYWIKFFSYLLVVTWLTITSVATSSVSTAPISSSLDERSGGEVNFLHTGCTPFLLTFFSLLNKIDVRNYFYSLVCYIFIMLETIFYE